MIWEKLTLAGLLNYMLLNIEFKNLICNLLKSFLKVNFLIIETKELGFVISQKSCNVN